MRARRLELRIIGVALVAAWGLAAALILLAYRPGGPLDVVVGVTMLVPLSIAVASVVWPPVARGRESYPVMVSLGVGALLLLLPSIGGVLNQLQALGSQTLLPSPEAAYPWFLALLGTSLFAGFGLARRVDRGLALRSRRLRLGIAAGLALALSAGTAFGAAAIANEVALRDRAQTAGVSRFGPTDAPEGAEPPACDGRLRAGPSARLTARFVGYVDGRQIGSVDLSGLRQATDFRWLGYVATNRELGQYGAARLGDRAWLRTPGDGWFTTEPSTVANASLDVRAMQTALVRQSRTAAEDRGIEVIEGARARRCRVAVDGGTFRAAFPQVRWLVGAADLDHWFGQLDYWVFLDGGLGQVAGSVNGEAGAIQAEAIQGTIEMLLTATERGRDVVVYPPTP